MGKLFFKHRACFNIAVSSLIIFISSCQKEIGTDQRTSVGSTNKAKIKSYNEKVTSSSINSDLTFNIGYDSKDRIISLISTSNPGDKFLYNYPSASKFTMELYNSGVLSIHEDVFLNTNLYRDSSFQFNDTQDTTTEKYIYNASNQLVKEKEYVYSKLTGSILDNTINYTYDANGDVIKSVGTDTNVYTYEYYSNLIYFMPILRPLNPGEDRKRRLMKKMTYTSNGYSVYSVDFSYTFDSKDRVETIKEVYDHGAIALLTFTYY